MGRLVDAFTAAEKVRERHGIPLGDLVDTFAEIPSADVEPVRHGHWLDALVGDTPVQVCDKCNTFFPLAYTGGGHNYCPNCGAKMDEEEIEDDRERTAD